MPRRLPSLQRRPLVFAAAVLAPVPIGALTCGVLLMFSATRSQDLAEELDAESAVSVSLFQNLELARIAGSPRIGRTRAAGSRGDDGDDADRTQ